MKIISLSHIGYALNCNLSMMSRFNVLVQVVCEAVYHVKSTRSEVILVSVCSS